MNRSFSLIHLLITCVILLMLESGCGKNKTVNVKLTVIDESSGTPISEAKVIFEYRDRPGSIDSKTEHAGYTDNEGIFHFKKHIGRRVYNPKLRISAAGYNNMWMTGSPVDISTGQKRSITKKLTPFYHFLVYVKNENCFNETDSVWIHNLADYPTNGWLMTGCADTTLNYGNYNFTNWTDSPVKTLYITVKRNGVTTSFEQTTPMVLKEITPIHIFY